MPRRPKEEPPVNGVWSISKYVSAIGAVIALVISVITLWNLLIYPAAAQFVDTRVSRSAQNVTDQIVTMRQELGRLKDLTLDNRINANALQIRSLDRERFDLQIQLDNATLPSQTRAVIQNRVRQLDAEIKGLTTENEWLRQSKGNL